MERYAEKGLLVLGLNREEDREAELAAVDELELNFPVLLGMQTTFEDYWVDGIPDSVLIDRQGNLVKRWTGYSPGMEEEVAAAIEEVLAAGD